MEKTTLSPHNDSCFIATGMNDNIPVTGRDKSPIMFMTLAAGKKYLKKRFKDNWTDYCFRMARYQLEEGTPVTIA